MKIIDKVWGENIIQEAFLIDLIMSSPVQRLKRISQGGLPRDPEANFSRYDHSIGVMLCLRYLNASIEEQAAGLIHDVSHTAFSHTIDRVVGNIHQADYQDRRHAVYIRKSELPEIYNRHGFAIQDAIDMERFILLERSAPDLCADRLDYTLRQWADNPTNISKEIVPSLRVYNGTIIFANRRNAELFTEIYSGLQENYWGGAEYMLRAELFASALRNGLQERVITIEDFDTDDNTVFGKIQTCNHASVRRPLELAIKPDLKFEIVKRGTSEAIPLYSKFRYVDPPYINGNGNSIKRMSDNNAAYTALLDSQRMRSRQGIHIILH